MAKFVVALFCCGREDGVYGPGTWAEMDEFREQYCSGPGVYDPHHPERGGHQRAGIITGSPLRDDMTARWMPRSQVFG